MPERTASMWEVNRTGRATGTQTRVISDLDLIGPRREPTTPKGRLDRKMEIAEQVLYARSGCAAHPHMNSWQNRETAIGLYIGAMEYALKHPELGKERAAAAAEEAFRLLGEKAADHIGNGNFTQARAAYQKAKRISVHLGSKQLGAVEGALEELDRTEKEKIEKEKRKNIRLLR